jgi:multidrug efflux pump subunit AcrA (membrane-fusion protein)
VLSILKLGPFGRARWYEHERNQQGGLRYGQLSLAAYGETFDTSDNLARGYQTDATESGRTPNGSRINNDAGTEGGPATSDFAVYKARVQLDAQVLRDSHGEKLTISPGMQVVAEINQGNRTVLEYLLSPVQKAVREAGRER